MPEPLAMMRLLSLGLGGRRAVRNLSRVLLPEAQWPRASEILREWPRAMSEDPLSRGTFVAQCFAVSLHFVVPRLAAIACPAVIVAGAEDALVPARNAAVLAERIPRAHLEIVPGAAHAVFADDRDLVRRMIARLESPPVAQPLDPSTASL